MSVEDEVPGEMVVGLKEQVRPAGAWQVSEIWLLNPATAAALTDKVVEAPGATVALEAERLREKLGEVTALAGTRLAKTLVALPPGGNWVGWRCLRP